MLIWWFLLFILGYILIYIAAEFLIEEVIESLERFQISPVVFGILLLGIEFEESAASIFAAVNGLPFLSMSNLIGNSLIAITISFATPFLIINVEQENFPLLYPTILIISILNIIAGFFLSSYYLISAVIAVLLFATTFGYSIYLQSSYEVTEEFDEEVEEDMELSTTMLFLRILGGVILIIVGGQLLVYSAENLIASTILSETFFGLIIMAFVTNGEELFLMVAAIRRGHYKLGIAAQLGKLLWNLTLVYAVSAFILGSFAAPQLLVFITLLLLVFSLILYFLIRLQRFSTASSIVFLLLFLIFIFLSLMTL